MDVPHTKRAAHVRATGVAAVVIDGMHEDRGWAPWCLLIRGRATVDDDAGLVRLTPLDIVSWGLDGFGPRPSRADAAAGTEPTAP